MNRSFAFVESIAFQANQTEWFIFFDGAVDHLLVSIFEDMEGLDDIGKEDKVRKGEERDFHLHPLIR